MRKVFAIFNLIFLLIVGLQAQNLKKTEEELNKRGEVYIKIQKEKETDLQSLSDIISIDKVENSNTGADIYAYLNQKQFKALRGARIGFELLQAPSLTVATTMCPDLSSVKNWDCYPTYGQYVELMNSYVTNFPELCILEEFGQSINGKKLLVLKISDNVSDKEEEPEFFYTSTMHGDEVVGYVLMLRLIDYLLNNYQVNAEVADLINRTEIWINPNSNPDGTYAAGDNTLTGATRFNQNFVDLNRNFPDAWAGLHPDGELWQKENIHMMEFLTRHNFVLSANLHGGVEVINYPWDYWTSMEKVHADDTWYYEISRKYADTVHIYNSNYMTYLDNGVTNGGDWYTVAGGRQDYMNYFMHGREVTIELSNLKLPDPTNLPAFWNYNYHSLLNYIKNVHFGVYGKITDQDGNPLKANLRLIDYDRDNSDIFSDSLTGMYYRMLPTGNYHILVSAYGYSQAEVFITLDDGDRLLQNIILQKWPVGIEQKTDIQYVTNPFCDFIKMNLKLNMPEEIEIELFDLMGRKVYHTVYEGIQGVNRISLPTKGVENGIYLCSVKTSTGTYKSKLLKVPEN